MKLARALSHILMAVGLLAVTWAFLAWRWQDPITGLYTWHQQRELAQQLHARPISVDRRSIAAIARLYRLASHDGEAMGRIMIPRIGLNAVLVEGSERAVIDGPCHVRPANHAHSDPLHTKGMGAAELFFRPWFTDPVGAEDRRETHPGPGARRRLGAPGGGAIALRGEP